MPKILIVDDEIGIRELLSEILTDEGYDVRAAENAAAARTARQEERPDLVLLDIWMPDTDGITLLKEWSANGQLNMPVVMMSGHGTIDTAVEATRIGAIDYLEKPIALQKLLSTVKRGLQRRESSVAPSPLGLAAFPRSLPLRDLRRRLEQVLARSRVVLMKTGPGSLAELARLSRAQQKNLAFAVDRLDRHDLRLVMATDQGPEELLAAGWEEPLVHRLFEVTVSLPSLFELRDEVPELATQILTHQVESGEVPLRHFSTAALNALRKHAWPGGFGALRAAVKSLALASLEDEISSEAVRDLLVKAPVGAEGLLLDQPLREAREAFERLYFEHHLRLEGGNMTRLAEKTGLERTHLYRKLKQLGLPAGRRHEDA